MKPPHTQSARTGLYAAAVFGFAILICSVSLVKGGGFRTLYLCALFALCASPIAYVRKWNGRDAILCVFLAAYFVFYGGLDLADILLGSATRRDLGLLTLTEVTVLGAATLVILGYRLGLRLATRREGRREPRDWATPNIVLVGGTIWAFGTAAIWIWQVYFQRNGVEFDTSVGTTTINIAVLLRMIQPLGILMLAYAYFKTQSRWLLVVLIAMTLAQVFVGFIGDSKELGMKSAILVLMTGFLVRARIPVGWLASIAVFAMFVFPIFQAYRAEIIMARGESRADAAKDIARSIDLAMESKDKASRGSHGRQRSQTFLERASLKGNLELILDRVGHGVRFQKGATLAPLLTAFIPRIILPDKADSSAGQLFNTEFRLSEDRRTYISPTQLGELYWNFGWSGVGIGMTLLGIGLGYVGARCDLGEHVTLTRLLILVTTIYAACIRFEGSTALEYTVWMRSMVVILFLHWVFARRSTRPTTEPTTARALVPNLLH